MKSNSAERQVVSQGTEAVGTFGLSDKSAVHIMTILRDTLYTDRVLAVLREYAANAWDAHREIGKGDVPIKVTLPTLMQPSLAIRDFGPGLDDHDVLQVYTQYGESSKRDTDDQVGALGIGCKSAFAYTDQFTVTSWHGGYKSVYVAVLDESNIGEMRRLDQEPCADDETGIEIRVPVKQADVAVFEERAKYLFAAFRPAPDINTNLPDPTPLTAGLGYIGDEQERWVAVMGCVPYRIDLEQISDSVSRGLKNSGGALYFDIGEVEITASREDLKYTDKTLEILRARMIELQDAYLEELADSLEGKTPWQQRISIHNLGQVLEFPVPKSFMHLWNSGGDIPASSGVTPKTFRWVTKEIRINLNTQLVIHDDPRRLSGFSLPYPSTVIRPVHRSTVEDVELELVIHLAKMNLTGIPVTHTSKMHWYGGNASSSSSNGEPSPKHRVQTFCLIPGRTVSEPKSSRWDITDREPTKDDIYIGIHRFEAMYNSGGSEFYRNYREDCKLAKFLGVEDKIPPIYGYKRDALSKAKGTNYKVWRETFFHQHISKEKRELLQSRGLLEVLGNERMSVNRLTTLREGLRKALGSRHLMVKATGRLCQAVRDRQSIPNIPGLAERCQINVKSALQTQTRLTNYYPLLANAGLFTYLERLGYYQADSLDLWTDYIKMADRDRRHQRRNP
mgnify:CR=1 FL=1|jgi:hypothetical protein